jgi:hypothetical protein
MRTLKAGYVRAVSAYGFGQLVGRLICIVLVVAAIVWFVRRRKQR